MKIKKIEISNLKAIDFQKIELNGCSVMVTGANQKGKTTLLQGMIDRIRGKRPSQIVKQGEKEGRGTMTLDNGEQFKWEFDNETLDKLTYITKDGHASRVTKEIALKYFPKPFNIDKFLVSQPKEQLTQLAELVGLDFESIDAEYLEAYNARTVKNKAEEVAKVKYESINEIPDKVDFVDSKTLVAEKQELTTKRENQYLKNKETNDGLRADFDLKKGEVRKAVKEFNDLQDKRAHTIESCTENLELLKMKGYTGLEVGVWLDTLPKPETQKVEADEIAKLEEPKYITPELPSDADILVVDGKINDLNAINDKAKLWKDYQDVKKEYDTARVEAEAANDKVQSIQARKKEMIAAANFPAGIEYADEGVMVDGRLLSDQNTSSSQKYCAAIRMGALKLGEVGALHFDASTLDRATLYEIEKWAQEFPGVEGGLQLLIERPAFEGGDISYELICNK